MGAVEEQGSDGAELSENLRVTRKMIREDLVLLKKQGLRVRVHSGAALAKGDQFENPHSDSLRPNTTAPHILSPPVIVRFLPQREDLPNRQPIE
ncbi:DeoR family transcriptional regulator [Fontibacillus phaseoli]|uniref:DeoR family transcriptional regulator n=1 Tax=Fontibacillus phaseoli TaxID=1416533 RepID=UPI000DF46A10